MATLQAAEAHQEGQAALASLALSELAKAWALFDPEDVAASIEHFRLAVQAVVTYYGRAAAAAALERFTQAREDAGVFGQSRTPNAPTIPEGFVDQLVAESAAAFLEDETAGRDLLDAGAEQLVLEQARRQMMSAARLDTEAKGWARIPNAGACSFCLMLALRGPVYNSKRSAGFSAHPNCRCTAEPVFGHWEPSARVREAQSLWDETVGNRKGHDARVAFRQAVEGRKVTGAPGKSSTSGKGKRRQDFKDASEIDPATFQRNQLRILQALPPAKTPAAAQWRERRIAEIRKFLGQ